MENVLIILACFIPLATYLMIQLVTESDFFEWIRLAKPKKVTSMSRYYVE